MKILGNTASAAVQRLGIPFLLKMEHEVIVFFLFFLFCFFFSHFIDDTLNTQAECVKDSLICRKYVSGQNISIKVYGNSVGTFTPEDFYVRLHITITGNYLYEGYTSVSSWFRNKLISHRARWDCVHRSFTTITVYQRTPDIGISEAWCFLHRIQTWSVVSRFNLVFWELSAKRHVSKFADIFMYFMTTAIDQQKNLTELRRTKMSRLITGIFT